MKSLITESVTNSVAEVESKGKVEKKSGKRIGYNYIIIKSYKESQKNDVVKCLYIKSLIDFGFCVIKEGSKGDTKDKDGRDIIDRLKWQQQLHDQLQDKIPMPRLLGHFEENGNYYLVIGHIKGKSLQKLISENKKELRQSIITGGKLGMKFLDYLIQITKILEKLHTHQIVHRDATPNNYMVMPGGKVALIDMEMCYSLESKFPTPAFALGTHGYMSKQQEAVSVPTTAEDIFALGAIILQIWSGVSPGKLTNEPVDELTRKISFFIYDEKVASLITQCLCPDDTIRPSATEILQVLTQYKTALKKGMTRSKNQAIFYTREEIITTIQQGIATLASPLLADEEKGWFADDMKPAPHADKHKLRMMWYASCTHGVSGILYMLSQAKKVGLDVSATQPYIGKALDLIKDKYIYREKPKPGFHFGSDGIAAVLSAAIQADLIDFNADHLNWMHSLLEHSSEFIDVGTGVAGQGVANLISRPLISQDGLQKRLHNYADLIISKQEQDGSWTNGHYIQRVTGRKLNRVAKGFVNGMAGIIYFLLEYGHLYKHQSSIEAAERGLRWLITKAQHRNNFVSWLSLKNKDLNYDLSNGTAGIALSFLKADSHTGKLPYQQYAQAALSEIPETLTDSTISQRFGLTGLGEVYIEAYKVCKDDIWMRRAESIAQTVMHLKKKHVKYGEYWLTENERLPVANFMLGNSGVLHFLLRCCYPYRLGFPLLPE